MKSNCRKITTFLIFSCLIFSVINYNHLIRFNYLNNDFNTEHIEFPSPSSTTVPLIEESWYEIWGSSGGEQGRAFAFDTSENIYMAGFTNSYGAGAYDFCLVKYNKKGDFQWFQTWGGASDDYANDIALDSSGNIYLTGNTYSYGAGGIDFCLVKFNNMGVFQWYRTWGGSDWDIGNAIAIDSYDNIYLGGTTYSYGAGSSDFCLLKYSNSGSLIWARTWGGSSGDSCGDLIIDSSDNILLGGATTSYGSGNYDICLVKFDSSGNFLSSKYWGGTDIDLCSSLAIDSSQNIYIAGSTNSYGNGSRDAILLKINNSTENLEWYRTWGGIGYDECSDISLDSFQNIYLAVTSTKFEEVFNDAFIIKFDNSGTQLWDLSWGGLNTESCDAIHVFQSENIYISGTTFSYGVGPSSMYLVKYISPPLITINSPNQYQIFEDSTFNYNLSIIEGNLNTTWYTLDGGLTNYTFSGTTGTIDQGAWDDCNEGNVTIRFYVNDTIGNLAYEDVMVFKDINAPQIFINSPHPNQLCGNSSVDFDLTIIEDILNATWYTLDEGLTNHTFSGTNGTINQAAWDLCGNGTVIIRFYAEDLTGKCNYSEVSVLKDINFPQIIISSPKPYQLFGETTFEFNITIIDLKLNYTWYTLNDGEKFYFTGTIGIIDQAAWDLCGNGTVSIKFFANNTAGNTLLEEIIVFKDVLCPIILNLSPIDNQGIGISTCNFNLSITEGNLNTTWYTLDDGLMNFTFSGTTGTINQGAWDDCNEGEITIRFYANDTFGNLAIKDVIVFKDISIPQIFINYPHLNQLCGNSTIDFDLTIIEDNLNATWYTLDEGLTNHTFSGTNGTIDQVLWDECPNGTILIRFYAKDIVGYLSYDEIVIRKDNAKPEISILNPTDYQIFGNSTFNFTLSIIEGNLNTTWYTLDGGLTNYTFSSTTGTINQGAWDDYNKGVVYLRFYANDSLGNLAHKDVVILKSFPLTPKRAFAIIVGVSNYPGSLNDLMCSRSDAITMQTMLRSKYNFLSGNMILLTDSQATRTAIFNAFTTIKNQMSNDDLFFFYFSGHGGEVSSSLHFFCPYDSVPSNPSLYIHDIELDNLLNQLPGTEKFIMIDACNSGGFISEVQASNRFIMSACQATQLSWETLELGHGVFTYYFVDSIFVGTDSNGDGVLSMEEQFSHASSETTSYMLGFGELQQPVKYDGVSGPAVLFPSLGSLSLLPIGNKLQFSFNLYGHGILQSLTITVCSVYKNISLNIVDLRPYSPSNTGFGHYSGTIQLEEGFNISGYELRVEIEGYSLIIIVNKFGDTDADGFYDIFEIINGLNPGLNDSDSDGLSDYDEYYGITDPLISDTDGDGMPDGYEVNNGLNPLIDDSLMDPDNDGLNNVIEYSLGTSVNNPDTDNDGISDGYEYINDLDLFSDDANLDYDNDGLDNILEFQIGSAANNADSDSDLMPDLWEFENDLDLQSNDANLDYDNDGLDNILEFQIGSAANNADSDSDLMPDLWEFENDLNLLSNDANLDPDEDGLQNVDEFLNDTDPHLEDTDGDEWSDGDEVNRDTDPTDPTDYPRSLDPSIPGYNILILIGISCVIIFFFLKKRTHEK